MTQQAAKQDTVIEISSVELPLSCPRPEDESWNMHPRVFLKFDKTTGNAECPYCGAIYHLQD